ncbi:alpha/beta hydrolase [Fluviicola sp.]|uniref:alpha/beta fold hydrolase n=1 Tax=Fluviicola sp. TaxID=1917219 RepID=UPI0031E11748
MEKPVYYILSGLGADERVFDQIDFGSISPVFIPWEPVDPDQTFGSYVKQLSSHIKSAHPVLIGISFGGIVAQEMSVLLNNCPVLIISSVRTRRELSPIMRFSGKIGLHKLISVKRIQKPNRVNYWLFGTQTQSERTLLDAIIADTDPVFAQWAIHQISNWKREERVPAKVIHIHGDQDRIFPISNVHPDYIIHEGTHFMTVSKHEEVSRVIRQALEEIRNSAFGIRNS